MSPPQSRDAQWGDPGDETDCSGAMSQALRSKVSARPAAVVIYHHHHHHYSYHSYYYCWW